MEDVKIKICPTSKVPITNVVWFHVFGVRAEVECLSYDDTCMWVACFGCRQR